MAYRILVVDDDRSIVKMIKDFLEMEEYHVDTALNGEDALRKAETHPDLIILDINLPSINHNSKRNRRCKPKEDTLPKMYKRRAEMCIYHFKFSLFM